MDTYICASLKLKTSFFQIITFQTIILKLELTLPLGIFNNHLMNLSDIKVPILAVATWQFHLESDFPASKISVPQQTFPPNYFPCQFITPRQFFTPAIIFPWQLSDPVYSGLLHQVKAFLYLMDMEFSGLSNIVVLWRGYKKFVMEIINFDTHHCIVSFWD